ncbi:MAG: diguanylate cyclase (GGDEF)-like protein/PAS domain S-box-containing protein [Oleispira sp.]|jgi:diguanylate cyclase (GGDEF)-like protein/PAS domain S-box-containing protein
MKLLNAQTVRTKFVIIAVTASTLILLITTIAFLSLELFLGQQNLNKKISVLGQVIAERSTAALIFDDDTLLHSNLASLSVDSSIVRSCIYDRENVLAASHSARNNVKVCPKLLGTLTTNKVSYIEHYFPIKLDNQVIGTLYIACHDGNNMARFKQVSFFAICILFAAIFITLLLATRLQRIVTNPLRLLADTISNIIQRNDFSIRAKKQHNDELGQLADIFNELLSKIESEHNSLKGSEEKFRKLTSLSPVGIFQINPVGEIVYVNQRWREINNIKHQEPDLQSWFASLHPEDAPALNKLWHRLVTEHQDMACEVRLVAANGNISWAYIQATTLHSKDGKLLGFLGSVADISELKKAQIQMENLAFYDPLTGLANRRLFKNRLEKAVKSVQRTDNSIALLFLDLDQFKRINDTLGHDIGDALLKEIARRLNNNVRENDTVCRIGGDEFTILLTDVNNTNDVRIVAEKILLSLACPFMLNGQEIMSTVSIGITMTPEDSIEPNTLMKNADLAMYRAKELGRNNFQFFCEDMNTAILHNLEIEKELHVAIKRNQFILMYQPKICITDNTITGVETLVRWQHPEKGIIPPDSFIPIAEETGQIIKIGAWVLEHSCHQMGALIREGLMPENSKVAVNLSAKQFSDPNLLQTVLDILRQSKIDPFNLELEITESIIMDDVEAAISIMEAIKSKGIHLSIDDFGTGYSSLAYLKRFPIDVLKVDRSFISDIPGDTTNMAITSAVIAMGHKLGMKVVAEGIETQEQLDFLKENNCDYGQGYLLSRPLTLPQLHHFLVSHYKQTKKKDS